MLLKLLILSSDNKQAAEVATSVKNIFISIYRTSEAIKCKSAATLSTIAATFCSIIIETHQKSHRKPTDVPEISYGGRLICREFFAQKQQNAPKNMQISNKMHQKKCIFLRE